MYCELEFMESSSVHPVRFFEEIYTHENLNKFLSCYVERIPDKNDENDYYYSKFPVTIHPDNLTWEYDYEVKVGENEDDSPIIEWRTRIVTLDDAYFKFTRDEVVTTLNYIVESIDFKEKTKTKNYLRRIIKRLISIHETELNGLLNHKQIFTEPIKEIIRELYINYTTLTPPQEIHPLVQVILSEKEHSKSFLLKKGYKIELANSILQLDMKLGGSVIKLRAIDDKNNFVSFLSKDFSSLEKKVIHFEGEIGIINFFLARVILDSSLKLSKIESLKIFQINGFQFEAEKGSKEKSRITTRNEHKQSIIEDHLNDFLH